MEGYPPGDALAQTKDDFAVIGRESYLGFDFQAAVVRVEERNGAGGALKAGEKFA
jgi:hypothetical protein